MPLLNSPLFLLALGTTGFVCTGILLVDILKIRKQLHTESGFRKSNKQKKIV